MEKIASFTVNHDVLQPGIYVSRIDGDIITYDLRMKVPNGGDYLSNGAMHTIEHLFATFVRNGVYGDKVIYVGPMGCRTGFYLILRDCVEKSEVINLVKSAYAFIADYSGKVPGAEKKECGNYLEHDLAAANEEAATMCEVIKNWQPENMNYKD